MHNRLHVLLPDKLRHGMYKRRNQLWIPITNTLDSRAFEHQMVLKHQISEAWGACLRYMLCYVMLCYVMLCYVLSYVMLYAL